MATNSQIQLNEVFTPPEHIPMCGKHYLIIDISCEDCDEFICSQCAKTDHKYHDWNTILTAGSIRRKELKRTLSKVKEEDLKELDEKIKIAERQLKENKKYCASEIAKLQKHFDDIVSKLHGIKKKLETRFSSNLSSKNADVGNKKLNMATRRDKIKELVKFLEEKHSTMSDFSLIDNLRDLTYLVSNGDCDVDKGAHSVRYRKGDISEKSLESMMGETFDFDDITATETNSFLYGDNTLVVMEALNEETCYLESLISNHFEKVNICNESDKIIKMHVSGVCVTDDVVVYATDYDSSSIVRLSLSNSVSTAFSTAPLTPEGICQSTEGGLLVTLRDIKSEHYQLDSHSRRLVRHVTLTGDVIREYEYQEDGHARLFTVPGRIKQNGNTDICVVNFSSINTGELVILSLSGSLKSVYQGRKLGFQFNPTDLVCDSLCNIIVSEYNLNQIHLLSPDGGFMKYLLTENEITGTFAMSLYKSTLWLGNNHGLVKIFKYINKVQIKKICEDVAK